MRWSGISLTKYLEEEAFIKRVTIEAISDKQARIRCSYCRGRGKDSWGGMSCHICHGKGAVLILTPFTRCAFCRGTGRAVRGEAITCAVCFGKGSLTLPAQFERCSECAGLGRSKDHLTCTICGGRGFVSTGEKRGQALLF